MANIERISIVGYGNVGKALAKFFDSKGVEIVEVVVRVQPEASDSKLNFVQLTDLTLLEPVDMVLVCVNDSSVNDVLNGLTPSQYVAYTSGAVSLEEVDRKENVGVFYPLQTFSGEVVKEMENVPILLESEDKCFLFNMTIFAKKYFNRIEEMASTEREKLHLAAVMANNFSNHLYYLASEYLKRNNMDFSLLHPLIKETINKLEGKTPYDAQTGPARRGDELVIKKHEGKLDGLELELYRLFSQSIKETYEIAMIKNRKQE